MEPSEDELVTHVLAAARAFRVGMEPYGNRCLGLVVGLILERLTTVPPLLALRLQKTIKVTFEAQRRGDYLLIADLLEYEIAPAFGIHIS